MGSQEQPATRITLHTMFTLLLLLGLATSSPIGRSTRQTNMVLIRAREGQTQPQSRQDFEDIDVPAGEAVDIFYRYGFFSLSVRVVPRDDHGSWIVREPTTKVFTPNSTLSFRYFSATMSLILRSITFTTSKQKE